MFEFFNHSSKQSAIARNHLQTAPPRSIIESLSALMWRGINYDARYAMKATKQQYDFMEWEFGVFLHFGIRTFNEGHRDWDMKEMPLSSFNPTNLDCRQWMRVITQAGAKYAILVCKHHDGFANWPSRYTDNSVANTPWKDGKGDVVREFTDACREYGVKVGLYYSPADFAAKTRSAAEHDEYFINQITELLGNYGKIDYLWFDGCGSEGHTYDEKRIVGVIRSLQPEILLFNMWDPDTRWVGNESGYCPYPNPLVVDSTDFSVLTDKKDNLGQRRFLPVECDYRMRLHNWFFSDQDEHTVKSLDELIGQYYYTIGRGANLLINIAPNREGKLPERDSQRLIELGNFIRTAFSAPLPGKFSGDGKRFIYETEHPQLVNHLVLKESADTLDTITGFTLKAYPYEYGEPITVYEGHTVGHKAVCPFPTFFTRKLELTINEPAVFSEMSLHFVGNKN